ncbi:MAG: hypothetical protein A2V64_12175 [Bacteroidetes bacterium RBG_13_43_22]|nr:MAG: hypothetical protein A2V64_12175 [Bacteroidetes bacterium RBG_13_43_22]
MPHKVFISYSSIDKNSADIVCSVLEQNGIPCWIAPRDITPGVSFAEAIIDAIKESRVFILIYSQNSNHSSQVIKEVDRAVHHGLAVITLRMEDVPMSKQLEYYISDVHWLDAMAPPLEEHINRLSRVVKMLMSKDEGKDDDIEKAIRKGTLRLGRTGKPGSGTGRYRSPWKNAVAAAAVMMAILVAVLLVIPRMSKQMDKSVAVLPFTNLSGDPDQEYFSDGMMDEILDRLFKIGDLKVISRTSSMRYKNSNLSLKKIARELGVATILEGSVRRMGDRVRITVQLIDAKTDSHLWSEIYDRDFSDIFSIQSEVAQAIGRKLKMVISPEEKSLIEKSPTANMAAYDAYLKGMFYWRKLTANDIYNALKYFDLALEKDSLYSLAYAGRSGVWAGLQQMGIKRAFEVSSDWEKDAYRAVELDGNSSEAHHALAGYLTWSEWDWDKAWPEWKRTIELNPNNPDVLTYYSHFLCNIGHIDEALPLIEKALDLDPFNSLYHSMYAAVLNYHCRYEEAIASARTALALQSDAPIAYSQLALALEGLGKKDEHLALVRERLARDPERLAAFEQGLITGGYEGAFRNDADILAKRYEEGTMRGGAVGIASHYRTAGDIKQAIDWLERAYEDRDGNLPYIGRPINSTLRSDPRFQELCRKLNIPCI